VFQKPKSEGRGNYPERGAAGACLSVGPKGALTRDWAGQKKVGGGIGLKKGGKNREKLTSSRLAKTLGGGEKGGGVYCNRESPGLG